MTRPAAGSWCASSATRRGRRFRTVYIEYLMKALPPIARAVSSSPDAYVYLAESIRAWPDQQGLADLVARAGWQQPRGATSPAASSPSTAPPADRALGGTRAPVGVPGCPYPQLAQGSVPKSARARSSDTTPPRGAAGVPEWQTVSRAT